MSPENSTTNGKSGTSPSTEGSGQSQIDTKSIMDSLNTIKGVVGDLATRQSEMERMLTETRELNDILSSVQSQSASQGYESEPKPKADQQNQEPDKPVTQKQLQQYLTNVSASINDQMTKLAETVDRIKVKDYERDPDFAQKVKPEAYKLSKQFPDKSLDEIIKMAQGNIALKDVNALKSQLSDAQKKLEEFEKKSSAGEKPGFWFGNEPPKEMTADEAHEDALEKAGLQNLPE